MLSTMSQFKFASVPIPETTRCPLCSRNLKRKGFQGHLRTCLVKHGMTTDEYEQAHPMDLYGPVHRFAARWFALAKFSWLRFGLMDYGGLKWCHVQANKPPDWYYQESPHGKHRKPETKPLLAQEDGKLCLRRSFWHFGKHLSGDLTLGIWPDLDNSFTMIDLDGDQVHGLNDLCDRLIDLRLHHAVEFSGKKGYHVWLFWDRVLPNDQLIQIHEYLAQGVPCDHEVWPFKKGLIKLPLGLHRDTETLACFLDDTFQPFPLDEQLDYFLGIKTNKPPEIPGCSRKSCATKKVHDGTQAVKTQPVKGKGHSGGKEWAVTADQCHYMLDTPSISSNHSREILLGPLAAFLKDVDGLAREACVQRLNRWSRAVSSRSAKELEYDVERQVDWIYRKGVRLSSGKLVELTVEQKKVIGVYVYDLLHTPRSPHPASRPLDKGQRDKATATLTAMDSRINNLKYSA